jgi:List-Bact-rpt repeat protein/fibronectin type III domain protein
MRVLGGLLLAAIIPMATIAAGATPIASSSFTGAENPLSENGAWVPLVSLAPNGSRFQKNNGAFGTMADAPNHSSARSTASVPADQYSEIVVQHLGSRFDNVGPIVRVQPSGAAIDSHYLWFAGLNTGQTNGLYRIDANGTGYVATQFMSTPPVADGDTMRLIARGLVLYGLRNGVRVFVYNTGPTSVKYPSGSAGMLAYAGNGDVQGARIGSWSTGAAPTSSGTAASSNFAGTEDPLDEGDRWYPLPGYQGFSKAGGFVIGKDSGHNAAGAWSITPPSRQYSEVTLGSVAGGGGGPMVRIDRSSAGQTGWLLFVSAANPTWTGIYKATPDGIFTMVQGFTATVVTGDKWRLAADGNVLEVFRNGVSQLTYTTDGSYPSGDVGIETYTPSFTLSGWEGAGLGAPGDTTPPTAPANASATATSSSQITVAWDPSTDNIGVTSYLVERCQGAGCTTFAQIGTASASPYSDTGLSAETSYTYQVRATDAAGNKSAYSNAATATTQAAPPPAAPTITGFNPTSGPVGSAVTITGTDFTGATAVTFNGANALTFSVTSATSIQATVPPTATTGPLSVTTPGGTATSTNSFTVTLPLVVTKAGNGAGTATSTSDPASPSQISCQPTCSASYAPGTVVTLTAAAATGSTLSWSGCDAASGATCTVTMSGPKSVTVTFTLQKFVLTVTKSATLGVGKGTVTSTSSPSSPTQVDCGATCAVSYDYGTVVNLTAAPNLGSVFSSWTGCDSVSGSTGKICTVTVTAARSVDAKFLP